MASLPPDPDLRPDRPPPEPIPDSPDARPSLGFRPAPHQAGRLHALREALDDAATILGFVRAGLGSRDIDPDQVQWVIDLAPGDGERAWQILRTLADEAPRSPTIRYLARCLSPVHHAELASHPRLQPLLTDGRLWLDRTGTGLPPQPLSNPPVVLAHHAFSAAPQGLYAIRNGRLLEVCSDPQGRIAWRVPSRRDGPMHLLTAYRHAFTNVVVTLPIAAMTLLDTVLEAAGGRLLLRASDHGGKDIAQIRAGVLDALHDEPLATHDRRQPLSADSGARLARDPGDRDVEWLASLPVNFEALARWHRSHCADSVRQSQRDDRGRVLHLALHDVPGGRLRECLPDLLALPHPDDHLESLRLLTAIPTCTAGQCLAAIHAQAADSRALLALHATIATLGPHLSGTARTAWHAFLERCYDRYYPGRQDRDDPAGTIRIAELAMALRHWPLARRTLRDLLRNDPKHARAWRMLAHCWPSTRQPH